MFLRHLSDQQHFWIIRHGDKYGSYPPCPAEGMCSERTGADDNSQLTECGVKQANATARFLMGEADKVGGIKHILASPYARTLQTSLPLVKLLNLQLKVEHLLSEANQQEGHFRQFNFTLGSETERQIKEVENLWDLNYGSPPIHPPESPELYVKRAEEMVKLLRRRFPPSSGNMAIYTHGIPAFSVAYGLCFGEASSDEKLKDFVDKQDAIGPGGVIHVVLDGNGKCVTVDQTYNEAASAMACGKTRPDKCEFEDFPAWYWASSKGQGPGKCGGVMQF